jgi:hypothetical protein|tara:strand:- start:1090 stop:1329 length:240 start_codon:yes stop_codon:yes gene_type:complete
MEISALDFFMINLLSYIAGLGSGLIICCKNKDIFLGRSRSSDNLRGQDIYNVTNPPPSQPIVQASAPTIPPQVTKITLE